MSKKSKMSHKRKVSNLCEVVAQDENVGEYAFERNKRKKRIRFSTVQYQCKETKIEKDVEMIVKDRKRRTWQCGIVVLNRGKGKGM